MNSRSCWRLFVVCRWLEEPSALHVALPLPRRASWRACETAIRLGRGATACQRSSNLLKVVYMSLSLLPVSPKHYPLAKRDIAFGPPTERGGLYASSTGGVLRGRYQESGHELGPRTGRVQEAGTLAASLSSSSSPLSTFTSRSSPTHPTHLTLSLQHHELLLHRSH